MKKTIVSKVIVRCEKCDFFVDSLNGDLFLTVEMAKNHVKETGHAVEVQKTKWFRYEQT